MYKDGMLKRNQFVLIWEESAQQVQMELGLLGCEGWMDERSRVQRPQ